ncbi:MAG: carboxymuconolactone decarboxylase family protein [Rubrivivax sp.]|nr:carboxymuconolactone decarboxylase family protein [Rubrivivax sp.]
MNARIAPAEPPYAATVQAWLARTMPPGMPPLRLFTTLARDERLFGKFFAGGLLDRGHLALRQREIVIDRTTARCRSEYEWGVHVALFGERVGLTAAQLASLVHGDAGDPCWSDDDRLLIRLCDELLDTCTIGEPLWRELHAAYTEPALLELLLLAGCYRTVSTLTNALALPLEDRAARFPAR